MARTLNITVGGEEARIRCSVVGEVLHIVTSKCYAEYVKLMKLATEHKCEMPVPAGSDQVRPPLAPGKPVREALCMKDMGAFNADMPMRFLDNADKHIKAFLAGKDVPKDFDSKPIQPGKAQMFTIEEVQAIAKESAKQALEAAGHIAKAQPVAELIIEGDGERGVGLDAVETIDLTDLNDKQREFAEKVLSGFKDVDALTDMGYKPRSLKATLTNFKKIPVLAEIIADRENAG